ncbi:MAG: lipopolysaccharide biosynthesis protein [Gemmatimonadales bacterium]
MNEKPRGLTRSALGGMVWTAWGAGAMAVLKLAVLVLLTRLLSPADFGVVSAALVVIAFSLNFSQLGLGPALVQRPVLEPRHVSTAFFASTGFGLLVAAAIWLAAPAIAQFFKMDSLAQVVRVLALLFPLAGVSAAPESLLQRDLRFRLLANRDVFAYAVGYGGVGVGLALLGWGIWALVGAQLAQVTIRTVILLRAAPPLFRARPTWASFLELVGFGAGQSIARMGIILANQLDNLVVGRWMGAVALGNYSRAFQFMAVPTGLLGDVLDKVLFPTMARVQDDPRRLAAGYLRGTALLALILAPAGVVAAVLAPELVAVAFGKKWAGIIPPFQVLALGMMLRTGYRMSDSLSRATGKVYRRAWRQWLFAAMVFTGAWLGHYEGLTGVAVGVLIAFFINYVLMAQLSLAVTGITWARFVQAQLPALQLASLLALVTLGVTAITRHLALPAAVGLAIGCLAAAVTTVLAIWLAPTLALGEHGMGTRDIVRAYLTSRIQSANLRRS